MTTQRPVTQQDIEAFNSLVNKVLVHRDRNQSHLLSGSQRRPASSLVEQRQVARECGQFVINLKTQGKSIEHLAESAGLGKGDAGLAKFVCMSLIGEELQPRVIQALSDEVSFIVGSGLLKQYEQQVRQAVLIHVGDALPGSEGYVEPFVNPGLDFTDDLDVNALRSAMNPAAVSMKLIGIFARRKDGVYTPEQCVASIKDLLKNSRLQEQKIQSEAKNLLSGLPLHENEALREFILGKQSPTLSELSAKTFALLQVAAEASTSEKAYSALKDIVYGAHSVEHYAMRCLADDLTDAIREHVSQDERGMSDDFNASNTKLKGFVDGFSLMRKNGIPVDFILLRAACENRAGDAYDQLSKGAPSVINYLYNSFKLCPRPQMSDLGCITPLYLLGGIFSHEVKDLKAAAENDEARAAFFYSLTGNKDFLQMIKSEKAQSDILAKDLGL